jgi:hypothetical protein
MTQEDLIKLKAMPRWDRVEKYLPLLLKGDITHATYEFVLKVGVPNTSSSPHRESEPQCSSEGEMGDIRDDEINRGSGIHGHTGSSSETEVGTIPQAHAVQRSDEVLLVRNSNGNELGGHVQDEDGKAIGDEEDARGAKRPPERCEGERTEIQRGHGGLQTTHTNRRTGVSQKQRLLSLLSDGEWHDSPEIIREVYGDKLTGARYGARIQDLKESGHEIESEKVEGSRWKYRIVDRKPCNEEKNTGELISCEEGKFEDILNNISSG